MYQAQIRRTGALIKAIIIVDADYQCTKRQTYFVDSNRFGQNAKNTKYSKTNRNKNRRSDGFTDSQTRRHNDAHVTCDSCRHQPPAACEHRMRDQRERNASTPSFRAVHSNRTNTNMMKSKQQNCKSHYRVTTVYDLIRHAHYPRPLYQPQSPATTANSQRDPPQRPQSAQCCHSG